MKKIIIALCSAMLLLSGTTAWSQNDKKKEKFEFVKEKNISKSYPASGNKLSIDNSFGHVKFIATSGNEIKVNIHIEASSNKEEHAQRIFESISVSDKQDGNTVRFKTSINQKKDDYNCKNCNSSMEINYEISLPVSVALDVENSFGNTEIPDYSGEVSISSKFGNLTTGALQNVKSIHVEFGKADIKSLSNIDANFKFSQITIGNLSGKNKIHLEFCDDTKIGLDNNIGSLKLNESYSTVNLRPTAGLSASYAISTSFGSLVDRSNAGITRTDKPDKYGPDSEKTFSGQSGSGTAKIDIKSSFGKIIIGEATADDLKDKSKSKTKDKNKGQKQVI